MKSLSSLVKFSNPVGIELTMVPKKIPKKFLYKPVYDIYRINFYWDQLANFRNVAKNTDYPENYWQRVHSDPGCVECPSPILESWSQSRKWYDAIQDINEKSNLTTFSEQEDCGGGHIHVGNLRWQTMMNLFASECHPKASKYSRMHGEKYFYVSDPLSPLSL